MVEGRHGGQVLGLGEGRGDGVPVLMRAVVGDDAGAQRLGAGTLHGRRVGGYDDGAGQAVGGGGARQALRVVAR